MTQGFSSGGPKEAVIVTPLMDFIRQKRAAKSGSQVWWCYLAYSY